MQLRFLDEAGVAEVYRDHLRRDFPAGELKPLAAVTHAMAAGIYEPLALSEGGQLVAYAWQAVLPGCPTGLLDYFAVLPALRGTGTGSRALAALGAFYTGRLTTLLMECEHPAEAPDPVTARRRIGFYLRAGCRATALESRVFGTRYQIYALPCGGADTDASLDADLKKIYAAMVPEPYYRGHVIFYGT